MKYILIASLLSSSVLAAPFFGWQSNGGNNNGGNQQSSQQLQQGGASQQPSQQSSQQSSPQLQQGGTSQQSGTQNVNTGAGAGVPGANGQTPTAGDLATAVSNWMADTSMVSNFLDTGASIQNNAAFKQAALVAYNAEVDELNHKAIIDAANGGQPNVQAANSTLATGGAFQDVVDKLQIMSVQGKAAANNIDLINQNRCTNVLPNIDAYMASTGSTSQAVRPQVCDQTGIAGGVQGQGPTLPGQPAGTPQAAFAAAQALQQGTGNGQLNLQAGGAAPQTNTGGNTGTTGSAGTTGSTGTTGPTGTAGTTGAIGQQPQGQTGSAGQTQTGNNLQGSQNSNGQQAAQPSSAAGANTAAGGNAAAGAAAAQPSSAAGANTAAGGNAAAGAATASVPTGAGAGNPRPSASPAGQGGNNN